MKVFADTFYWIALTNPRDSFHGTVLEFSRSLRPQAIVTTDEVLTELLTFCAVDRQLRVEAAPVVKRCPCRRACPRHSADEGELSHGACSLPGPSRQGLYSEGPG